MPLFAAAYAAASLLHKGLGFVLLLWLARALPPEAYALFGVLYALQAGMATFAGAGIGDAVIGQLRHYAESQARAALHGAARAVFVGMASAAAAVALVAHPLVTRAGSAQANLGLVALVVAGGVLIALFTLQSTLVRLQERHAAALTLGSLAPLIGWTGAALGFWIDASVRGFFAGLLAGLLLALASCVALRLTPWGLRTRAEAPAAIARGTGPYLLIAALAWLGGYGSTYIVQALFTAVDVATFVFVYTLSSILQVVASSANQVWSPRFYALVPQLAADDLERRNRRFFDRQGLVLGLIGGAVLLAYDPALRLLGGQLIAYRGLQVELLWLFAGYAAAIPWWHAQNYFLVHNQGQQLMRLVALSSAAGLAAWVAAMLLLGRIGVYIGFCLNMAIRSAASHWVGQRQWNLRLAWRGALLAAALPAAGAWAAQA